MKNVEPGTEAYKKEIIKRIRLNVAVAILGIVGIAGTFIAIQLGLPQSDLARLLTVFLYLLFFIMILFACFTGLILKLESWSQTKLEQLKKEQ